MRAGVDLHVDTAAIFMQLRPYVPALVGPFWNSAIRASVCPSVCLSHGAAV